MPYKRRHLSLYGKRKKMLLRLPFLALLELLRLFLLMWMSVSQISSLTFGAQLVLNLKTDKGDFFLIHASMHLFRVQSRLRAVHRYHSSWRAALTEENPLISVLPSQSSLESHPIGLRVPSTDPCTIGFRAWARAWIEILASFFSLVRKSSQLIVKF